MTVAELYDESRRIHNDVVAVIPNEEIWDSFASEADEVGLYFPSRKPLNGYFDATGVSFPVGIVIHHNRMITYMDDPSEIVCYRVLSYDPPDNTPFLTDDLSSILNP